MRFRLAVSTGFVIATVGFLVIGADTRSGVAQSIWNILGLPDGGADGQRAERSPPPPSAQYRAARGHRARTEARGEERADRNRGRRVRVADRGDDDHKTRKSRRRHARDGKSAPDQPDNVRKVRFAATTQPPASSARKSMCVRLCDGFAFPVGNYYGDGDRLPHEAACKSECPGAETALFVLPAGSDSLADATNVKTGLNYSKVPDAFHYTSFVQDACTCHPPGASRAASLLRDFTLRRGDAVMTRNGLQVFHGGSGFPFKRKDFVALSRSRDIRLTDRSALREIERASLVVPTRVAGSRSSPTVSTSDGGKGKLSFEHQARN